MLSRCFFYFSVGVGAFVTGLSQISSFLSLHLQTTLQGYRCNNLRKTFRKFFRSYFELLSCGAISIQEYAS